MIATLRPLERGLARGAAPEWHGPIDDVTVAGIGRPATQAGGDIGLEVVSTRAGLECLEVEWNALFARAARDMHLFQSFNWIWHWANHFLFARGTDGESCGLYIVTARVNGRLAMVWPMHRQRTAGLTLLTFAGEPVGQYGDLLLDGAGQGERVLERAWDFVVEHANADAISLRNVRADSNIATLLAHVGARVTERQVAPYLDLASAPDFATYEQRFSSKARKNRRRLLRRFEERAPASISRFEAGERAGELATLAISLKRAWLKDRGLYSRALTNPNSRRFFAAVASDDKRPVGVSVVSLQTRGEAAAIEVAFDCKGRRAVHLIVYALKYENASAGQLLIEQSVRNAFDMGLGTYDLLAPGDAYKLEWADGCVDVLSYAVGLTARGRIYAAAYLGQGRRLLKKTVNTATRLMRRLSAGDRVQRG